MSDPTPQPTITQDATGAESSIRWGLLVSLWLGGAIIIAGLVGWFMHLPDASIFVGAGSGLILGAMGAKGWQAQAEYRPAQTYREQ